MHTSRTALLLAALTTGAAFSLSTPSALRAQDSARAGGTPGAVVPGALVRVRGRDLVIGREPARVVEQHGDTLLLRARDGSFALVPLDRVTDLQVAHGKRSRADGAWRGARAGALVGGVSTLALTAVAVGSDLGHHDPCSDVCIPAWPIAIVAGAAITTVTTLAGAAIGVAGPRGDRWVRVPSAVRVGVGPTPGGGAAVAVGLRF